MQRLNQLQTVLQKQDIKGPQNIRNKEQWFKNNGWGFKDTEFVLNDDGSVHISGSRYQFSGQKMPKFKEWVETVIGLDINATSQAQKQIPADPPVQNPQFIESIKNQVDQIVTAKNSRVFHSHGHSMQELYYLRHSKLPRTVDYVVYITSHQQAQHLIQKAKQHNVVLIPFGGYVFIFISRGTNVTESLMLQESEKRTIVSVDCTRMNKIKWVDKNNMMACIEAGIIGKDMEKELSKFGVCCGHEPDSVQFSSLGGWVSTRASGMKKNRYGNIDDIVVGIKIATPIGTFQRQQKSPRISSGPDVHEFILGHEGNFGIITEVIIKLRPIPEHRIYESVIFHDFEIGTKFMYEVSQCKVWPASIRLVDNQQFVFGMSLKTQQKSKFHEVANKAKKYFVTEIMKFDPNKMCLCTILFEGRKDEVDNQQKIIYDLAKKHQGFRAGAENGERGYFLTFMIGYLRDFGFKYHFIAESFQTSLPWKDVSKMCNAVSNRIESDCKRLGIKKKPFISFRVTQVYDTGACVYIYFGFIYQGLADPVAAYSQIQDSARQQIMKHGGSISHHHGVGKLRKKFLANSIGQTGVNMLKGLKQTIDPSNIFATGNLI